MQRDPLFQALEESPHEVAEESHARRSGALEGEARQLYTESLERLLGAALGNDGVNQLLARLLEAFCRMAGADAGIAYLREGAALAPRVSSGLDATPEAALEIEAALEGRALGRPLEPFAVTAPGALFPERSFVEQ